MRSGSSGMSMRHEHELQSCILHNHDRRCWQSHQHLSLFMSLVC